MSCTQGGENQGIKKHPEALSISIPQDKNKDNNPLPVFPSKIQVIILRSTKTKAKIWKVIIHLDTVTGYRWILSDAERVHIVSLLKTWTDAITLRGNIMAQERRVCVYCGKHSGLDDLVHNALALGFHSDDFMLDVLQHGSSMMGLLSRSLPSQGD
ncbi:hypothetical protein BDV38DRAFT_282078 [Aspergillus pseudotamarii]|uniref:Uncharacterized protein n=1 Tax=Aspergillus pseudotamarii TaxID=132259 RepID=A0A5N6SUP6_ASPPS|nr:uncharacterized protein BDV38DRAFT_282078 [Aspergillus pseudotamarii]KAE8138406.1 hypothetical protein BDV38DRAFT_282078 [Aspergillus pseudotamarii]